MFKRVSLMYNNIGNKYLLLAVSFYTDKERFTARFRHKFDKNMQLMKSVKNFLSQAHSSDCKFQCFCKQNKNQRLKIC